MPNSILYKLFAIFSLVIVIFVSGCDDTDNPVLDGDQEENYIPAELNTQFQLKVYQTALIKSENIKIRLLNVTADSRCPSDVVCIWAGEVKILVNAMKDDQDLGDLTLTRQAGNDELATRTFDGFSIKLVKVDPYPVSTKKIELSEYIVTLVVELRQK